MREKFKSWLLNDQLFYGLVVILIGIASFGLGRASSFETAQIEPVIQMIEPITLTANAVATNPSTAAQGSSPQAIDSQKPFLASKNGTRYYLSSCSGAKRIKSENIIYFSTREAAESAGYTKAINCAGL